MPTNHGYFPEKTFVNAFLHWVFFSGVYGNLWIKRKHVSEAVLLGRVGLHSMLRERDKDRYGHVINWWSQKKRHWERKDSPTIVLRGFFLLKARFPWKNLCLSLLTILKVVFYSALLISEEQTSKCEEGSFLSNLYRVYMCYQIQDRSARPSDTLSYGPGRKHLGLSILQGVKVIWRCNSQKGSFCEKKNCTVYGKLSFSKEILTRLLAQSAAGNGVLVSE